MFSERVTVETAGKKPSRRFSSAVQGHFRPLENGDVQKCQNDIKAERADLRMIDVNLFPDEGLQWLLNGLAD